MSERNRTRLRATLAMLVLLSTSGLVLGQAGQVNINTAAAEELALLPRVGPSVAARIIEFRETNGSFKSVEDLMLVRGIGEKTFETLRPFVKLEGDTDLEEKVSASRAKGADASR